MQIFKDSLRTAAPRSVAYGSYFKALIENEVEFRLLPWLCDKRRTSIDVGAFTGLYSVGASLFSERVVAIEPQQKQAQMLRRSMPYNVAVIECALSDVSGNGVLKMESSEGGSMSHLDSDGNVNGDVDWLRVPVRLERMDDLLEQNCAIGFIKIDAEGHELEVLRGGAQILVRDKPVLLIESEERHSSGAVARLHCLLSGYGYLGYFIYRDHLYKINDFDPDKYQDVRLITGGVRREYMDYVNNFVFVNATSNVKMPSRVPSAARAIFCAMAAYCQNRLTW